MGQRYRTCFFSSVFSRLQSLWNFWIASQPSSAQTFFLLVLLLSTMLCLSLNLWNQLLLPLNFAASATPRHASIFDFIFFNQSLDTLLPAALRSLNSAIKRLEARGYLSVRWDLFPAILLLCLIGLVFLRHGQSQFCKNFAFVFFPLNHQRSVDSLLLCNCFVFIIQKIQCFFMKSTVGRCRTFACFFPFDCFLAFESDLAQHRPIHAVDSQPFSACLFHLTGC